MKSSYGPWWFISTRLPPSVSFLLKFRLFVVWYELLFLLFDLSS